MHGTRQKPVAGGAGCGIILDMKKVKEFDCVRVKDEIQARLTRQWRGLTDKQIRRRIQDQLATSQSPMAKLWRSAEGKAETPAKPAVKGLTARRSRRTRSPA